MKKVLSLIFCAIMCAGAISFVGCSDEKKQCEGIYYFHDGTGELPGYVSCRFDTRDEATGLYPNVVGGVVDFTKFYIELKGGKMTLHGSITHTVTPDGLKILVNSDAVKEYEYVLVPRGEGYYGYNIYIDDKDSGYIVSPPTGYHSSDYDSGSISYSYGNQGKDLYVIYNYTKQQSKKFLQN